VIELPIDQFCFAGESGGCEEPRTIPAKTAEALK
jgi:hypothetical protein